MQQKFEKSVVAAASVGDAGLRLGPPHSYLLPLCERFDRCDTLKWPGRAGPGAAVCALGEKEANHVVSVSTGTTGKN